MFDGTLQRYENRPEQVSHPTESRWSWEFAALVLTLTSLSIIAVLIFPDAFRYPIEVF